MKNAVYWMLPDKSLIQRIPMQNLAGAICKRYHALIFVKRYSIFMTPIIQQVA